MTALRPFDLMLQKSSNLVDRCYSVQKSTYKGFVAFFKQFSSIQKQHSEKLLKLSKQAGNYISLKLPLTECLAKENQVIKNIINELLYGAAGQSQMYYNFSQRLSEVAETFTGLYQGIKAAKDQAMLILTQTYPNAVAKAGAYRQGQQKKALKGIYDILDRLHQHQLHRVQKIRENMIIAFSLHKKICEKQQQMLSTNNQRLSSIQTQKIAEQISGYVKQVMNLHNAYPGQSKIQPKAAEKVVQPLKDSLRQSVILRRQQVNMERIQVSKNNLRQVELQATDQINRLVIPLDQKFQNKRGLFSKQITSYFELSQKIDSLALGRLAYAMLEGFYFNKMHDAVIKGTLTGIRIRLKAENKATVLSQNLNGFLQNEYNRRSEQIKTLTNNLINLSRFYSGKIDQTALKSEFNQPKAPSIMSITEPIHVWVSSVIVNILIDTLIVPKQGEDFLMSNYPEIFKIICDFAVAYFNIQPQLCLFLFLQKVLRIQSYREQKGLIPVLQQLDSLINLNQYKPQQLSQYSVYLYNKLRNTLTQNLIHLYNIEAHNSLAVQCLCWLQQFVKTKDWVLEHIHQCVRIAGFKWITEQDQNKALLGNAWQSNQKLKLLSEVLNQNQFQQIQLKVLRVIGDKIVLELNLEYQAVIKKLRQKFFTFIIQIILLNLDTIPIKQLVDKDGYCLRLGIQLCKIDILCSYNVSIYDNFFAMLSVSLANMQSEYKQLLLQTKKTQLWIVEQNMYATQNCYDFCTLLAKPIEYMSGVIRQLGEQGYSPFKTKFIITVKIKLHEILRVELVNYMAFMSHSVRKLQKTQPRVQVDPPKLQKIPSVTPDSLKNDYFTFKQSCKRLSNIIFIKQNSNQIVQQMLSPQSFQRIQDIFNPDTMKRETESGKAEQKQLLLRIQQIVKQMNRYQDRTIYSLSTGTVLTYMKPLLDRLYWRQPKQTNAFQDFFNGGNKQKLRLSEYTLMSHKQMIEDYMMLIKRNVPIQHYQRFCQLFFSMLGLAVKCEIINPNKFRIPIQIKTICDYLNVDIANITNVMKKELNDDEIVIRCFYEPLMKVLRDLREDGNKLIEAYQKAMISKNQLLIDEILSILFIRGASDKKLKEYVKRIRNSMK